MSSYRDVNHFKNLFKAADADGNGLLEASELKDHLALESKIQENIKTMMKTANLEECIEKVFIEFFMKSIDVSGAAMNTRLFQNAAISRNITIKVLNSFKNGGTVRRNKKKIIFSKL